MSGFPNELFERVAGARREWMACFDAITDWVFVKAPDLKIIKANRAAAALFHLLPQQLIGHTCEELFGGDVPPTDEVLVKLTFETRQPQDADFGDLPVAGEFHIATYPLLDDGGRVLAVVEYIRDVTEQKAMQRQILQSARLAAVGELAAGIAHNFGNILMGVGGSLEVMLQVGESEGLAPRAMERMKMMHRELMRGDSIVKRLLSFARGSDPSIEPVAPAEVMEGVVALCQAHPLCKGIDIQWEAAPDTPAARADPTQLREVMMNLVLNALQATPKGGLVHLFAAPSGGPGEGVASFHKLAPGGQRLIVGASTLGGPAVDLVVADTGCGIPAKDMPRLFTPFFSQRLDGSQGTGLGLCVSLGMIESMGGRILVESCVGRGTRFVITLPASE